MVEFFRRLFSSDFMPHGGCYFWRPDIIWLHAASDAVIAFAYFLIPFSLVQLVRKRRDLEFNGMFVLFGAFILACGLTHLLRVWNIWHSMYRLSGLIDAITALLSIATAILMFWLVPRALAVPSPAQLRVEVAERKKAETEVRLLNEDLERRVEQRTAMLTRSNEALQRFAYIASHDLQEPIRTVRSLNQLLARDYKAQLDEKAARYLYFILDASDRMQTLVRDLLVYSKTVEESPQLSEPVSTAAVINEVLEDLTLAIQEAQGSIECGKLPDVWVAHTHLKQIFLNLIGNALKYRKPGRPARVAIRAERHGGECVFSVSDEGIGIDPKYFDQIFVAFRRLHGREYAGSGVGLTICKNLVEGYGGHIWVKSALGKGAAFLFTLPTSIGEYATCGGSRRGDVNAR